MTQAQTLPVTIEEVIKSPPQERWEIVNGELRILMSGSFNHGRIAMNVGLLLYNHIKRERLGIVLAAETGFILTRNPDTLRAPDVAFVHADRLPPEEEVGFFKGVPDLAVEVVSPNDRRREVRDKADQWIEAGTRLVWVIWPETRSVTVHRPGDIEPHILHDDDILDGEDVVPGFTCGVSEIFS